MVRTYKMAEQFAGYTEPDAALYECQMSMPYVLAAALCDGQLGPQQFSLQRRQDPTLHRLSRRVEVVEDPELSLAYPGKTASQVKLVLKDGRKFEGRIEHHKGDPGNPISEAELSAKARNNCLKALGPQKSEAFITRINQLEKIPDISELIAWL